MNFWTKIRLFIQCVHYSPALSKFLWVLNFSYQKSYKTCSCLVQVEWDTFDSPFTLDVGNQWKRKLGLLHSVWKYRKKVSFFNFQKFQVFPKFFFVIFVHLNFWLWNEKLRHFLEFCPLWGCLLEGSFTSKREFLLPGPFNFSFAATTTSTQSITKISK